MTTKSSGLTSNNNGEEICSLSVSFEELKQFFAELQTEKDINFDNLCELCNINPKLLDEQDRSKLRLLQIAFELLMATFELVENSTETEIYETTSAN